MAPKTKAQAASAETTKKAKKGLAVGDQIFDFELETEESTPDARKTAKISDLVKDSGIVLFFYPRANTPGCTKQAVGFKDEYQKFVDAGFKVFGMSADKPKSQRTWKDKFGLPYSFLCDPEFQVMPKLGISSGGKITRSHIVIAQGGRVQDVRIKVAPLDSVEEALKAVAGGRPAPKELADAAEVEKLAAAGSEKAAAALHKEEEEEEEEEEQQEEKAAAPAKKAKKGAAAKGKKAAAAEAAVEEEAEKEEVMEEEEEEEKPAKKASGAGKGKAKKEAEAAAAEEPKKKASGAGKKASGAAKK